MTRRLDDSPTHLLHRVLQCSNSIFLGEVNEADLTPRQALVLLTVARNEGLSQTGIVERTGIDRSTLADVVRRLQKKGLLLRRRTRHDARAYAVNLTDEGKRILRSAVQVMQRVDARVLGALPAREREGFIAALRTILGVLESKSTHRT